MSTETSQFQNTHVVNNATRKPKSRLVDQAARATWLGYSDMPEASIFAPSRLLWSLGSISTYCNLNMDTEKNVLSEDSSVKY